MSTLGEVAGRLVISVRHLSRIIAAGDLPVVRLGTRVVRIARTDLDGGGQGRIVVLA